jgi:pyruvate,water dikinase
MERRVLRQWKPPIVNDFMAMIFYGLLKSTILKWKLDETGSLQNRLLSDQGDVESTLPIKRLQEIASFLRTRPDLKLKVSSETAQQLAAYFLGPDRKFSASEARLREMLVAYLDDYGFRCMNELKLEEPSLKDRPDFLFTILKNYLSGAEPIVGLVEEKESAIAMRAAQSQLKGQRLFKIIPKVWIFNLLVRYAKKAVKVREYQRFARTKMFGLMRGLFRACGQKFFDLGLIDDPQDVFYLTRDEIFATISGTSSTENIGAVARQRKSEFDVYRVEEELPDRIITRGATLSRDLKPSSTSVDFSAPLKGTSCCPGVVRGKVKVIASPSDDMSLNGEILVAARTDPGWVTLYPSAIGLLIERGSVLSHSAIVARELGLPAIVGIPNITKVLKTGDWVEMDAGKGTVKILDQKEIDHVCEA